MSLQTGVADCEENPVTQIVTMKFYEVQDYLIMTQPGKLRELCESA